MKGRHRTLETTGDPVGRALAGVWLVGYVATAFTLGSLITDNPAHDTGGRPSAAQPDLDPQQEAHGL